MSEQLTTSQSIRDANANSYALGSYALAPFNMLKAELVGVYGTELLNDLNKIIKCYQVYERGADFNSEGAKDYTPSDMRFKLAKSLINKEARFMFAQTPSITIRTSDKAIKTAETQSYVEEVLKKNKFGIKLLRAGKDCFIGKRVAIIVDFNDKGVFLSFAPSLEFIYESDPDDVDRVTKFVRFWTIHDSYNKMEQRIFKKKYWLDENGFCHISEGIYNGTGSVVEVRREDLKTALTEIPVHIIINDGLTGDPMGESEVEELVEYESNYNNWQTLILTACAKE